MRGARPERALDRLARAALRPPRGSRVLVACSGGPDSVALAALVDRLARRDGYDLALAHVNHGVRAAAAQDECVALSVGARLERRVHVVRLARGRSDEAALREVRYAALYDLARTHCAPFVVTAHTAEDQSETILLALFRGTGAEGLLGMAPRRPLGDGVELVRPLLRASHAELAMELRYGGLPYARDASNEDARYRRNALRPHLAALRADFPHLDRAVARCAEILRDETAQTPRSAQRRALRTRLRAAGALRGATFAHIEAAIDAADELPARDRADTL